MRRTSNRRVAAVVLFLATILVCNLVGHSQADTIETFSSTVEFTVPTAGVDLSRADTSMRSGHGDHCSLHNCVVTYSLQANRPVVVGFRVEALHPRLRPTNQTSLFRPPIRVASSRVTLIDIRGTRPDIQSAVGAANGRA